MTTIKEAYENGCQLALYELRKFAAEIEGPTVGERGLGAIGGGMAGSGLGVATAIPLLARGHIRSGLAAPIIGGALGTGIGAGLTPESTSTGGAYGMAGGAALGGLAGLGLADTGMSVMKHIIEAEGNKVPAPGAEMTRALSAEGVPKALAEGAGHLRPWHGRVLGGLTGAGLGGLAGLGLGSLAGMPGWFKSED